MMTYTEKGLALVADAVASGEQVQFTRIELIADSERSAGELTYNAEIASVEKYNSTTIDIKTVTDNYNFENDYFFNQVNVYATGSDGQEVLFCFQHTETCPVYIPKYDGRTIQNEIKIRVTVTSADVVDIVNDGVYVLRTDFEKELAKKINISDIVQDATAGEIDKVVSAAVAKALQEQIDGKIDIKNIVQNAVTAATDKVVSAAVAKDLQDQIIAQNTKIKNFHIENSNWVDEYTFTLNKYGHYLLIINKGTAVSMAVVFNFTSSVPQVFWINTASATLAVTASTNALKVTSKDTTTFWASCINLSVG